MCGRFNIRTNSREFSEYFDAVPPDEAALIRYNIAPTQSVLTVRVNHDAREAASLRWGLIPSWSKDTKGGAKLINARSETASTKPSFRAAFKKRRCLIPASGYYEWQGAPGAKQPYHIFPSRGGLMALAGLWEHWNPPEGDSVESCAILTTQANSTLSELHDRMPVIVSPNDFDAWLANETSIERLVDLLRPAPEDLLDFQTISTRINNVRHEGPECLATA